MCIVQVTSESWGYSESSQHAEGQDVIDECHLHVSRHSLTLISRHDVLDVCSHPVSSALT